MEVVLLVFVEKIFCLMIYKCMHYGFQLAAKHFFIGFGFKFISMNWVFSEHSRYVIGRLIRLKSRFSALFITSCTKEIHLIYNFRFRD